MNHSAKYLVLGVLLACAIPVHAYPLISFSLLYTPAEISGDSTVSGDLQFYLTDPNDNFIPQGPPIDVLAAAGGSFHTDFIPTEPCFGDPNNACDLGVSFNGTTSVGSFPAFIFDQLSDLPSAVPSGPPIIPVAALSQSGRLVMYDAPVVVGSWDLTVLRVPEPASVLLIASGLGMLTLIRRKRLN